MPAPASAPATPSKATVEDLGKKVKAKFPGQYDDLSDADLGQKVKAKHPEYGDFADMPAPATAPAAQPGILSRAASNLGRSTYNLYTKGMGGGMNDQQGQMVDGKWQQAPIPGPSDWWAGIKKFAHNPLGTVQEGFAEDPMGTLAAAGGLRGLREIPASTTVPVTEGVGAAMRAAPASIAEHASLSHPIRMAPRVAKDLAGAYQKGAGVARTDLAAASNRAANPPRAVPPVEQATPPAMEPIQSALPSGRIPPGIAGPRQSIDLPPLPTQAPAPLAAPPVQELSAIPGTLPSGRIPPGFSGPRPGSPAAPARVPLWQSPTALSKVSELQIPPAPAPAPMAAPPMGQRISAPNLPPPPTFETVPESSVQAPTAPPSSAPAAQRITENRTVRATEMAKFLHEHGITLDEIEAMEAASPTESALFWNNMGRLNPLQSHYNPSPDTISLTKTILRTGGIQP